MASRVPFRVQGSEPPGVGSGLTALARDIKPHIEAVITDIRERIAEGEEPTKAVDTTIREARKPNYLNSRKSCDQSSRIVASTADYVESLSSDLELVDFATIDRSCILEWVHSLRAGIATLKSLVSRLERL